MKGKKSDLEALEATKKMFDGFFKKNPLDKKPSDKGEGGGCLEIRVVSSKTLRAN